MANSSADSSERQQETLGFALLLILLNAPLLLGGSVANLSFQLEAVRQGAWWRLVTCSLVHVSWYHLLLDGSAFLLLYGGLKERLRWKRLCYLVAADAGSLAAGWLVSPLFMRIGFCGLSGIDH